MALTRVNYTVQLCTKENCTKLTVEDITGDYDAITNPLGYGLPGGIEFSDISTQTINLYYPKLTNPVKYILTYTSGILTALTYTNLNNVVTDITSQISTLYVDGVFNLIDATGVILPTFIDGIYTFDSTIIGTKESESFSYTTSGGGLVACGINCCIANLYKELDMECDCHHDKIKSIEHAELFLSAAIYAVHIGQDSKAQGFIDKAKEICSSNCETC